MIGLTRQCFVWLAIVVFFLSVNACKERDKVTAAKDLPDLNQQIRPFVTTDKTTVRSGPGQQFRTIGEIRQDSKVNVVGRDGEWLLIVSKIGSAPGYIAVNSVRPATGDEKELAAPSAEGRYEAIAETKVRSGAGVGYPAVANLKKGTLFDVVDEDKGWLKVESKHGNPPGYVDVNSARRVEAAKGAGR